MDFYENMLWIGLFSRGGGSPPHTTTAPAVRLALCMPRLFSMFCFVTLHRVPANLLPPFENPHRPTPYCQTPVRGANSQNFRAYVGSHLLCGNAVRQQESQSVQALMAHDAEEELETTGFFPRFPNVL